MTTDGLMNYATADGILGRWEAEILDVSDDAEIESERAWADVRITLRQIRGIRALLMNLDLARLTPRQKRDQAEAVKPSRRILNDRESELRALMAAALSACEVSQEDADRIFARDDAGRLCRTATHARLRARVWWLMRHVHEWMAWAGDSPQCEEINWITTGYREHTTVRSAIERIDGEMRQIVRQLAA